MNSPFESKVQYYTQVFHCVGVFYGGTIKGKEWEGLFRGFVFPMEEDSSGFGWAECEAMSGAPLRDFVQGQLGKVN